MRITELLAIRVHVPVAGLQSSAACTAPRGSLKPPALVPPVTRTSPVGSTVALRCRRGEGTGPGYIPSGFGWLRLLISAAFVGGGAPPPLRIFPRSGPSLGP